jgi:LemA protein
MIPALIVIGVILIIIIGFIAGYNKLVKRGITVDEAFSTMDVYLKKRFDLIPNLVETVKGYAKHESETLQQIASLRGKSYDSMSQEEKIANGTALSQAIPKILAVAESYPELRASENFQQLTSQLSKVEDEIANSRKYYNGAVKQYNLAVQTVPNNIVAGLFHFKTRQMFEVNSNQERENVKVEF